MIDEEALPGRIVAAYSVDQGEKEEAAGRERKYGKRGRRVVRRAN